MILPTSQEYSLLNTVRPQLNGEQLIGILLTQILPNASDMDSKFKTLTYQAIVD